MFDVVLFDLDGTLTESGIGITRSVAYSLRKFGIEKHLLAGGRMHKSQSLCMQRLTRTHLETVAHKLAVLAEVSSFENFVAPVTIVIEKGVTNVFHMYPNLMCTACFEVTLHK